jgi:cyclomaltodextrin glucanotransferase
VHFDADPNVSDPMIPLPRRGTSMRPMPLLSCSLLALALAGANFAHAEAASSAPRDYYGTLEPFASEAVYFVVTDRFVNGDPANDFRDQGGKHGSFDIPLTCPDGVVDNIGYLGGDFRGLLDHASYIREMGFTAVWITPIAENPDQRFTGGDPITCSSILSDRGKAAYHGYWAINFHRVDEHLPSADLDFTGLTQGLRAAGLKTVLDIVGNHGSPAWTMPERQAQFGQMFDADGKLVADHGNLAPSELDPQGNPLHAWFNREGHLAQLADLDASNPAVVEYLVSAYLKWIDQGADAFRVDTIAYQPHAFWKSVADRVRARRPGFFMFAEHFDYDAAKIAAHTREENGRYSVLDFPLKQAMNEVFEGGAGFERLAPALHLSGGPYRNPYDLTTFYDNHDMARINADDAGFIDAHHWLFTARGIPVVYYGSEMGFMRGAVEHHGNRNYSGVENIAAARSHPIRRALSRIAQARAGSVALQRGLQLNLELQGDRAAFYRVYQHDGVTQTALVLLNKGDAPQSFALGKSLQPGRWRNVFPEVRTTLDVAAGAALALEVGPHQAAVWLLDAPITRPELTRQLDDLMPSRGSR